MSGNLCRVDLNSDAVLVEPENDEHAVHVSGSVTPEREMDKVRDSEGTNGSEDVVVDGLSSGRAERKIDSVGGGINLEMEIETVGRPSVAETEDGDVCIQDVDKVTETRSVKVAENHFGQVYELVKEENSVAMSSRSGFGENGSAAGSLPGIMGVEERVAKSNDFFPHKDLNQQLASDGVDSEAMEIDEKAKTFEAEAAGHGVLDAGVLQENVDLVDMNLDVRTQKIVEGDVHLRAAVSKREFNVSDLVWGKVGTYPWWPGQIFDPSAASKKAKKYFKKDAYLIAYFGDQTFAWNEESRIKSFRPHFSQLEKQSSLEDFQHAVDCALDEVSRRVEFGLACSCIEEYCRLRTQIIVNAGIREESSRRDGGDSFSSAASFEPVTLVENIKAFGLSPFDEINRLELVTVQAQLLALNRWKGYSQLPEFKIFSATFESGAETPHENSNELNENPGTKVDSEHVLSVKAMSNRQDKISHKRKRVSGDDLASSKKEKSLSSMLAERCLSVSSHKSELDRKGTGRQISSSMSKKKKGVDSISDDLEVKQSKSVLSSHGDNNSESSTGNINSQQTKRTYRVGDSILRVASQLNGPTQILKSVDGSSQETAVKNNKRKRKSLPEKSQAKKLFKVEDSSLEEMVSQLCLVARDPVKHSFLKSLVFFVEFRNSVCLDHPSSQQPQHSSLEQGPVSNMVNESTKSEATTTELNLMKQSAHTDTMVEHIPEGQSSPEDHDEDEESAPETVIRNDPSLDSEQPANGTLGLESVKPVDCLEENCISDPCPTALILNFKDFDSVPSLANLNEIFRHFGQLKEAETKVFKTTPRAKVIFCRRADAESAFSSAGKYSAFGPSLVSYSLKYMLSTPSKSPLNSRKSVKKDATPVKQNAA